MAVEYVDVETARGLPGLRLALTRGVPGPWGEAAKGVFHAKGIPFVRVAQSAGRDNDELFAWTGHRNAPVAVYEDEPPCAGWEEILWLAERLRPEPALVPEALDQRVEMFGLARELMGRHGLGWCRRLTMFHASVGDGEEPPEALRPVLGRMFVQYGYSRAAAEAAPGRIVAILERLSRQLAAQHEAGSDYLIGKSPTALDLYWAAMAALFSPLPDDLCPMSEGMRRTYSDAGPELARALDPVLLEHRDRIYRDHMELPIAL